ncbi:uncharacterized protein LOC143376080 isoform X2 [Andrena cerasifolii]|uniref:uncharacterized protein LOC143376080 isoform X2 n=1 Tax=Andrena cerasifolii TaxID=2819439 RepID=UPI00403782B7
MHNSAEEENPPIPDTLGDENAFPMKSNDVINENQSSVANHAAHESNSENHNSISTISTNLSPTEEYLKMMRHLIESNSLSPGTTVILQDLYDMFKSIKGYGPTTWGRPADFETATTSRQFDEDKSPLQPGTYPSEDATADLKDSHSGQEEKPSASNERETLPIDWRGSDKLDHQKERKSRTTSTDEDRQHQIRFEAEEDYHFGRPCNSDVFKIDNIFSSFSLKEIGQEKALKNTPVTW